MIDAVSSSGAPGDIAVRLIARARFTAAEDIASLWTSLLLEKNKNDKLISAEYCRIGQQGHKISTT